MSLANQNEIARIDKRLRSPWLFYSSKRKGARAIGLADNGTVFVNLEHLKAKAIASLRQAGRDDPALTQAISALRWSDVRDAFAAHIFDSSGGNIFLVRRALDHNHVATTQHYLRQRRQLRQRLDAFRKVVETALTEVKQGRTVDPTILFLASNYSDFGEEDREKLLAYRTRLGMGCRNPVDPESHLAPNHVVGTPCAVQRCVLCRHGIVFKDAYEGLADRHGDLVWLRNNIPPNRWLTSSLSWELEAIELVRDRVFTESADAFRRRSEARVSEVLSGQAYVFDDPEIMVGRH
ncbi:hypothetical protein [Rubellimicrobium mesophilum]|uniref:hypothetical protein n=1 Tax=Rubellimicrobium mesophilum TaxID=1123067 RepID=UPI0012E22DD2|nr:hypothetical protein [Rubellimicrobium mesophilum]